MTRQNDCEKIAIDEVSVGRMIVDKMSSYKCKGGTT